MNPIGILLSKQMNTEHSVMLNSTIVDYINKEEWI